MRNNIELQERGGAGTVLITGASGLLGQALVGESRKNDLKVLAHYHRRPGPEQVGVRWIKGDFSDVAGTRAFIRRNRAAFASCRYFIHNYGPITFKDTKDLRGEDFQSDLMGNLVVAAEITFHLLRHAPLVAVVFIGYAEAGRTRAFKKILTYALAKNALLDLTRALAKAFPAVRGNMVSPVSLAGGRFQKHSESAISPGRVAERVVHVLLSRSSGRHFIARI